MEYRREYFLKQDEIMELVKGFVEYRKVIFENGIFYGVFKDGRKLMIEREWLKKYVADITDILADNDIDDIDLISILYLLDQDIFRIGWEETDKKFPIMCQRLIDSCKVSLMNFLKTKPDDVIKMIEFAMQYEDQRETINGYILQLLDEKILTEQVLRESAFFKRMSRDELARWCIKGKISANILAEMDNLKGITITQIRQLSKVDFFNNLNPEEFERLYKNGFCNAKGIIELQKRGKIQREQALELLGGIDTIARTYRRFVENKNKKDAKTYFEIFEPQEILYLYLNGKLTREDFERVDFDKDTIVKLSETDFLKLAQRGLPQGIHFTREELLEGYIKTYSGKTLIELSKAGYIEPEKLLELTDMKINEENKDRGIQSKDLLELYNPEMISTLLNERRIDINFINKLDVNVLSKLEEQQRHEYLKEIHISQDTLMDMFLEGDLSEKAVIKSFNEGIFGLEEISTIYGENYSTIIKLVKGSILDEKALCILPKDELEESLILEELTVEEVFNIYAKYNGIKAEELRDIFDGYEEDIDQRVNVVDMINNDFDADKIRELFINDILTHSDVLELRERGIITEEQSEEIAQINRERLYNEIFGKGITSETDGRETDVNSREYLGRTLFPVTAKTPMLSAKKREEFFKKVGKCDFRDVKARDTQGRVAPFGGYELIGFPEYGIVIFENFDKANNATYIMTLQELKSYVTKEDNDSIIFRKSKKALREEITRGRAVRVCNHTPNWGHNVIEAMKELSKETEKEINSQKQTRLADMMRKEFVRSRIEQIGGKENPLATMLVETRANVAAKQVEQAKVKTFEAEVEQALGDKDISLDNLKEEVGEEEHGEK